MVRTAFANLFLRPFPASEWFRSDAARACVASAYYGVTIAASLFASVIFGEDVSWTYHRLMKRDFPSLRAVYSAQVYK